VRVQAGQWPRDRRLSARGAAVPHRRPRALPRAASTRRRGELTLTGSYGQVTVDARAGRIQRALADDDLSLESNMQSTRTASSDKPSTLCSLGASSPWATSSIPCAARSSASGRPGACAGRRALTSVVTDGENGPRLRCPAAPAWGSAKGEDKDWPNPCLPSQRYPAAADDPALSARLHPPRVAPPPGKPRRIRPQDAASWHGRW